MEFCVVDRCDLAGYETKGPQMYFILLASSLAISLIYIIAANAIISSVTSYMRYSSEGDFTGIIVSLVTSGVMLIVNIIYFKNRAHLFVN